MNKIKFIAAIFLLFTTVTLTSCDVEPIDSAIDLDDFNQPPNPTGGMFTASIEGESFSSNQVVGSYSNTSFGPQLSISGITTTGESISIQILNPSVGTTLANTIPETLLLFQYNATLTGGNSYASLNTTTNNSTGTITISSLNLTTNKVSGTFSFTGYNAVDSTNQKQITTGVFTNISFTNTVVVTPPPTGIAGTYLLTGFNTSVATDINNDGVSSTNQLNETTCFDDMLLILNANNTFTADSKGIEIIFDGTVEEIDCFTDPDYTGTWALNGSILSLTYTDEGEVFTDNYNVSGNTLSATVQGGEVVGTETTTGAPVYLTSDITIIYSKQ